MYDPVTLLLKACNTSEREFREAFGYSKQYMVDVTAATYTRLPDRMHRDLKQLTENKNVAVGQLLLDNYGVTQLDLAYERYQIITRDQNRDRFLSIAPNEWTDRLSPAHFYVKKTSGTPTRFSKDLKVPPQQVRRWISGQSKTTPESIELALRQIGYHWVRQLVEQQRAWIEEHT